ncbi:SEC14-like protein 2 [Lamellibrachia satsuma]|nr:SEC14-like protein 2 [Lamellibrachia satsuma]
MLRKHLEWRKAYGVDSLLDWKPPEVLVKYWPGGIYGCDKDGHPILYQLSKGFDAQGIIRSVKKSDMVKYHIYRMEQLMRRCDEESKKRGKVINKTMHISDLDGFDLSMLFTPCIADAMKQVFAIYEANYPDITFSSYVINAPSFFPVVFTLLKPFLSEETKKKVHVLGRNWKEELFAVVDREQLPTFWGGTGEDRDDIAYHVVHASPVPPRYYTTEAVNIDRSKMRCITVLKGGKFDIKFPVAEAGIVLRWLFTTDEYDVGYGVFCCTSDAPNDEQEVVPITRANAHFVPEDGTVVCPKPGKYVFRFDNTYSWMTNKKVYYELELMEPSKDPMFHERKPTTENAATTAASFKEVTHL